MRSLPGTGVGLGPRDLVTVVNPETKELSFGANAALNVSAWFVPALTALVAVPITVRGLGTDAYGLLTLVTALTGFLGLIELGLGTAIVRYLSYYRALDQGRPMLGIVRLRLCGSVSPA